MFRSLGFISSFYKSFCMFLTWIGLIWGSGFGVYKLFCKGYSLFWMRFRAGQGRAREGHRHRAHRAQGSAGQRRAAQGSAKGARGQGREGKGRAGKGRPEQRTGRAASWPQYSKKAPTPSPCPVTFTPSPFPRNAYIAARLHLQAQLFCLLMLVGSA